MPELPDYIAAALEHSKLGETLRVPELWLGLEEKLVPNPDIEDYATRWPQRVLNLIKNASHVYLPVLMDMPLAERDKVVADIEGHCQALIDLLQRYHLDHLLPDSELDALSESELNDLSENDPRLQWHWTRLLSELPGEMRIKMILVPGTHRDSRAHAFIRALMPAWRLIFGGPAWTEVSIVVRCLYGKQFDRRRLRLIEVKNQQEAKAAMCRK